MNQFEVRWPGGHAVRQSTLNAVRAWAGRKCLEVGAAVDIAAHDGRWLTTVKPHDGRTYGYAFVRRPRD